jgi:hypothetical protein
LETVALRREAAELLSRSRWWRDECLRELLRSRRWDPDKPSPGAAEPADIAIEPPSL